MRREITCRPPFGFGIIDWPDGDRARGEEKGALMRTWIAALGLAAVLSGAGHGAGAATSAGPQPFDSGRYGVEAACDRGSSAFLKCEVSIRDLVYETKLLNQELTFTPAGALGSQLIFWGNPAVGPKQGINVQLEPAEHGQPLPARARFQVVITEGARMTPVQSYAFVVPVASK
jgi:hypothetical protein